MKAFYHLLGNNLIANITNATVWFALTFWVYLETKSVFATGMVAGVYLVFTAGFGFWLGSIVDHNAKKTVMLGSSVVSAIFYALSLALVMLSPHFNVERSAANAVAVAGATFGLFGALFSAGSTVQTRALAKSETTSSIVFYFSIICALAGLVTLPFGWLVPTWSELAALVAIGILGGLAHIFLTESYRLAEASLIAPFDYTSMVWALVLGYLVFSAFGGLARQRYWVATMMPPQMDASPPAR